MATHINIKEFDTEDWYEIIKSEIKTKLYNDKEYELKALGSDYSINGSDLIYCYKTNLDYLLNNDDIPLSWCNFEVHVKNNKLQDIFVVA